MELPNLNALKSFIAVADCGSVTEAAGRMVVTQSGVSRQIAALEADLGFRLFDRVRGRLTINRRGIAFLREARRAVGAIEHLPRSARAIASGAYDRVRIAATSSIAFGLLPLVLARYLAERPGLPPSVSMRSLPEIAELEAQDQFDLVFAPLPVRLQRFEMVDMLRFELRLAGPAALIAGTGDEAGGESGGETDIALRDLDGVPFVSLDPFASYQESIERAFAGTGAAVSYVCETSSQLTASRLVELGVGCAFLDPFVAAAVAGPGIAIRRPVPGIALAYGVFAPPSMVMSAEAKAFLAMAVAAARQASE